MLGVGDHTFLKGSQRNVPNLPQILANNSLLTTTSRSLLKIGWGTQCTFWFEGVPELQEYIAKKNHQVLQGCN